MIALIDGDIVAYRCAASCERTVDGMRICEAPEEIALFRVEQLMQEIIHSTQADMYSCFLSQSHNFRYIVYPEYKANRRDTVDPVHRKACKQYLVDKWNAEFHEGYEADDALAWSQEQTPYDGNGFDLSPGSVICSIDKDLKQVSGLHYNFVKGETDDVSIIQGLSTFYQQVLIGDKTDNLIGLQGIGPKKAAKYLEGCYEEQEMFDTVYDLYQDKHQLAVNLMCMWLCREKGVTWAHHQKESQLIIPSTLEQELDQMLESMKSFTKTTSMEPITT